MPLRQRRTLSHWAPAYMTCPSASLPGRPWLVSHAWDVQPLPGCLDRAAAFRPAVREFPERSHPAPGAVGPGGRRRPRAGSEDGRDRHSRVTVPEEWGGSGADYLTCALMMEELGRCRRLCPWLGSGLLKSKHPGRSPSQDRGPLPIVERQRFDVRNHSRERATVWVVRPEDYTIGANRSSSTL